MDTTILEKIGLTKNQAEVYLGLLRLGSATAQQVIVESGLQRSPVYDALEKLQERGLVSSVIKDFKRYFQCASPKKFYSLLEEKKQELAQIMPELERLEGQKKEEINASVYKGKEGLKTIHLEMLKENKDIYVLGGKGLIFSEMEFFIPHFEKERVKKGLKWKVLWDKEAPKIPLLEGKILPKGNETKSVVNIFGDKVAICLWKEKQPTAFVIHNKDVADSFRTWFELIYRKV